MFHAVVRVLLKLFELIGCIACVITKNLTDQEARRIQLRNQKYSREWSLLSNVTWSREGNAFASVTYGGFTLITALLLISRCINSRSRPTLTEKIFLTVGMLFFFTIGSLVYASIEQVQPDLHDNALILGTLSYLVAILFLIDLADPMERTTNRSTQTIENELNFPNSQNSMQQNSSSLANIQSHLDYQNEITNENINNNKDKNIKSIHRVDLTPIPSPDIEAIPPNGYYFRPGDQVDIVQTKTLPVREQPIFAKVLLPEKKRPIKEKVIRPIRLYNEEYRENYLQSSNNDDRFYRADARTHYVNANSNNNNSNNYFMNSCKKNDEYPGPLPEKDYFTDDDNIDRPLKSGFVAQAARMWDKRAKRTGRREQNTLV
ncbi:uncharacterized protein LOC129613374 [Condylostylus longicornis]|uniref:uncharacterized protein LOC129613374 n=1 Tax=Condylostylus longicornis TaxID=2530218 RepID=UPI00244E5B9D|nr:uncharacterized protein LOC129613374 [Condylostylus longicornis]